MSEAKTPKRKQSQHEKFVKAAETLGCEASEDSFRATIKKIAKPGKESQKSKD